MNSCTVDDQDVIEDVSKTSQVQPEKFKPNQIDFSTENITPEFREKFIQDIVSAARSANPQVTLVMAEYITDGESNEMGQTVFFSNVGNRQLTYDFLAGDPRSLGVDLTVYAVDNTEGQTASGLSAAVTEAAIDRAMATWDGVRCSDTMFAKNVGDGNTDFGFVKAIFGFGGDLNSFYGDVQHAGFLPEAFFDIIEPGGSNFILGVTFTLLWNQDLNEDEVQEVAFREIYYNDNFPWGDGTDFDVETVALHESRHGLSQAHFGKAFGTDSNGKIHFSPRAVMNAAYSGIQTEIKGTDKAGHCSLWANWPNN